MLEENEMNEIQRTTEYLSELKKAYTQQGVGAAIALELRSTKRSISMRLDGIVNFWANAFDWQKSHQPAKTVKDNARHNYTDAKGQELFMVMKYALRQNKPEAAKEKNYSSKNHK